MRTMSLRRGAGTTGRPRRAVWLASATASMALLLGSLGSSIAPVPAAAAVTDLQVVDT